MAIHPKDRRASNPRLQCVVCGKWKRLHQRDKQPPHDSQQNFFGGCEFSGGGEHLARKGADTDVCARCCEIECRKIAAARLRNKQEVER